MFSYTIAATILASLAAYEAHRQGHNPVLYFAAVLTLTMATVAAWTRRME